MSETHQTIGREEEADAMLRHTQFSRGSGVFLLVLFLVSLAAVPTIQWVSVRSNPELRQKFFRSLQRLTRGGGIPSARKLHNFEKSLETDSVAFREIRPHTQTFLTQVLREGNEQVCVGAGGWLFYRKGVNHLGGEGFLKPQVLLRRRRNGVEEPNPIAGILRFRDQLAARGIKLAVLPVPDKASIYPEKLFPDHPPSSEPPHNASFFEFRTRLEKQGILFYDPTWALLKAKQRLAAAQWFAGDSHWTPMAGQVAARGLSDEIRKQNVLPPHREVRYSRREIVGADPGDMVGLLGLRKDQTLFRASSEPAGQILRPDGRQCEADPNADVLLLGDSFSGAYRYAGAGLVQQLSYYLRRPVDHIGVPNGGSWATRTKLRDEMLAGSDRLAGKKLVIYEFVVRDLSFGDWKSIDLPRPGATSPRDS